MLPPRWLSARKKTGRLSRCFCHRKICWICTRLRSKRSKRSRMGWTGYLQTEVDEVRSDAVRDGGEWSGARSSHVFQVKEGRIRDFKGPLTLSVLHLWSRSFLFRRLATGLSVLFLSPRRPSSENLQRCWSRFRTSHLVLGVLGEYVAKWGSRTEGSGRRVHLFVPDL